MNVVGDPNSQVRLRGLDDVFSGMLTSSTGDVFVLEPYSMADSGAVTVG